MKIRELLPSSLLASKQNNLGITTFFNKNTGTICYREKDGTVVEVGSNTAVISEIQSDIAALPTAPITTIVNITSAQILAMGTTPIELLPAPGVGKYYDIDKYSIEFTPSTTPYTLGLVTQIGLDHSNYIQNFITADLLTETIQVATSSNYEFTWDIIGVSLQKGYIPLNGAITLNTVNSSLNAANPTLGDGTLRVIITYTVRTFGA